MNILEKNEDLFNKKVIVTCTDGKVISGEWLEWWDEEDNSFLADDGLPVYESILIEQVSGIQTEIYIHDIKDIRQG